MAQTEIASSLQEDAAPINVRAMLRSSHLQPTVAVTATTTALAVSVGRGASSILVALAVLSGQLSVGWSNDYIDRHRDRDAGRRDKPIVAGEVSPQAIAGGALVALTCCVPLSLASGVVAGVVHLSAVAAAWAYNAGLKSSVASPLPYAYAFGAVPAFVTLGLPGSPWPPAWAVSAGALMGVGAHFVNTLADRADDEAAGVRGLPQRLPPLAALMTGTGLLAAASLTTALAPPGAPTTTGVAFAALALAASAVVVVTALTGRPRAAWSLTLAVAALTVAGFLAGGADFVP